MNIGTKISELRKEKNLSQEEFAESLNVSRQTVSNWENNKCFPDIETLITISKKYNISLDNLLKNDKELVKSISKKAKLNKLLKIILLITILLSTIIFIISNKHYHHKIEATKKEYINIKEKHSLLSVEKDRISNIEAIKKNSIVNIYLNESDMYNEDLKPIVKNAKIIKTNDNYILLEISDEEYYVIQKFMYHGYNLLIKNAN